MNMRVMRDESCSSCSWAIMTLKDDAEAISADDMIASYGLTASDHLPRIAGTLLERHRCAQAGNRTAS